MRVIALVAAYNEERFIVSCVEHLIAHGLEVYLLDNGSTDRTAELAEPYLGKGLLEIENLPRDGVYRWKSILRRKEELAESLDADWFMHTDPDEVRLPPSPDISLAQAFSKLDDEGYNAVNFSEFTFIPTRESPDHDHPQFEKTMRWYYPYKTDALHGLKAWKHPSRYRRATIVRSLGRRRSAKKTELAWSGGHRVRFRDMRIYPRSFPMRHYLFLSIPHAIEKYVEREYDRTEVRSGWHRWRAAVTPEALRLPPASELTVYESDYTLDASNPRSEHYVAQWVKDQRALASVTV